MRENKTDFVACSRNVESPVFEKHTTSHDMTSFGIESVNL